MDPTYQRPLLVNEIFTHVSLSPQAVISADTVNQAACQAHYYGYHVYINIKLLHYMLGIAS